MNYKYQGENSLRSLYASANDPSVSYVIVRPGGLADGPADGATAIELNQGDTIAGEINRADVAQCVAAAAISKTLPPNVTFEVYESDRSGPLESKYSSKSGLERNGALLNGDYDEMFKGLKSD